MDDLKLLLRYATRLLIWIAPVEFLLGRAISRAARQMPAGEVGAAIFGAISNIGAFLVMPAFILVALILLLSAGAALRAPAPKGASKEAPSGPPAEVRLPRFLAGALIALLVFSVAFLFPATPLPLLFLYNLLSAVVILGIAATFLLRRAGTVALRVTVALFGLAYLGYYLYALAAILAQGAGLPVGELGVAANAAGEAAAMAAGISLLWTAGLFRRTPGVARIHPLWLILAGLAGAIVLIAPLFETWLQGVATQFSVGFTLFLPVPVSALALAAYCYALLAAGSRRAPAITGLPWAWEVGAALCLLPAAGYQLQLNYQHLLLAAVLLLITGTIRPLSSAVPRAESAPAATPAPWPEGRAAEQGPVR
jgi:hypothetical protein